MADTQSRPTQPCMGGMASSEPAQSDEAAAPTCTEESFSYELLLRKSSDACMLGSMVEDASTEEPSSPAASSGGSQQGTPVAMPSSPMLPSEHDLAAPGKDSVRLLSNVLLADKELLSLVRQARDLSKMAFGEDCLQDVTKKSGWKLSLLVTDDSTVLCGFIVSKVAPGRLSISKIAVPAQFRGHGFGKLIMEETMKAAKKQRDVCDVCLSSLPEAVKFYQRLGFKAYRDLKMKSEDELIEGQVYMEKRLRQRRR